MQLACRDIHFRFPGAEAPLFTSLNLTINGPGLHALFGPSGVGKSTLARMINGQVKAERGIVHFDAQGVPLYGYNLERLPGWSDIGRHLERITPPHNAATKELLIREFGLESVMGRHFHQLSLGQQNRVNLLRYLVQDFKALILDESLANVDEQMRGRILLTIKDTFPDRLFLYISHNVVEVAGFCRKIWVLRNCQKSPQVVCIAGQDRRTADEADRRALAETMLEIMNAV